MSLARSKDKLETMVGALEQVLPNKGLKRTVAAIIWRMRHGTPWRVIPGELGPLGSRRCGSRSCGDG